MVAIKGSTPSDRTVCKVMQRSLRIRRSPIHNSPPRDPLRDHRRERSDHVLTGEVSCKDEARIGQKNGQVRQWARAPERGQGSPADQRYDNAYLFGAICPAPRRRGRPSCCPTPSADMMQLHLDEILAQRRRRGAPTLFSSSTGAGWHTTGKLDVPDNITRADLPAFPRPGAEPGRERLAVPPPELALKHRLRKLRRDRRRRMRGLAKAHRSTRNDHLHRNARLGSRRSAAMTLGIRRRRSSTFPPAF